MTKKETREQKVERIHKEYTETERVIHSRRSVRLYKKEQVPDFMVRRILEAGRFAPSAGNAQPWKFIVLRDPAVIEELTSTVFRFLKLFRVLLDYRRPGFRWLRPFTKIFIRLNRYELHPVPFGAVDLIARERLGLFHGAPTVILLFKDVRGVGNPDLDCGIAGQNMVLAAHSMGLGTCWVSFLKPAFKYTGKWKRRFGIRHPYKFISSIAVGWPRGNPDGMVQRDTHAVDWYENGTRTVLTQGGDVRSLSLFDQFRMPDYSDTRQISWGEIQVDEGLCTGCGICTEACPADSLLVEGKKARMRPAEGVLTREPGLSQCIACGDCVAICPSRALTLKKSYRWTRYFKTLDRGPLAPPRLD